MWKRAWELLQLAPDPEDAGVEEEQSQLQKLQRNGDTEAEPFTLLELPVELIVAVFEYLTVPDLNAVRAAGCRLLTTVANDPSLWRAFYNCHRRYHSIGHVCRKRACADVVPCMCVATQIRCAYRGGIGGARRGGRRGRRRWRLAWQPGRRSGRREALRVAAASDHAHEEALLPVRRPAQLRGVPGQHAQVPEVHLHREAAARSRRDQALGARAEASTKRRRR